VSATRASGSTSRSEELEDFSTEKDGQGKHEYSKEEVEEGSRLLKEVLVKWKDEVRAAGDGMTKEEKIRMMRELVKGEERLVGNRFFQSVQTL
jgi:DNA mismatch repair protein MSH2